MAKAKPKTKLTKRPYKNRLAIDAYELAAEGMSNRSIAKMLGVTVTRFHSWVHSKSLLRYALKKGRELHNSRSDENFVAFVESRLTAAERQVWDRINAVQKKENALERLEAIFSRQGIKMRQHLFCYALCKGNFQTSKACRKVGISRATLKEWVERDPDFASLINHIHTCKKEYFESALLRKVHEGDTNAIILANKTQNRQADFLHDGYGDKLNVEVNGKVAHDHTHSHKIEVTDLNLPVETLRQIATAIKEKREAEENTVDAIAHTTKVKAITNGKVKQ